MDPRTEILNLMRYIAKTAYREAKKGKSLDRTTAEIYRDPQVKRMLSLLYPSDMRDEETPIHSAIRVFYDLGDSGDKPPSDDDIKEQTRKVLEPQ